MTQTPVRKLAVLLHADVVGSTSLVQKDETLAHTRIQDTFRQFSKTISNHGGITHEIRGDAMVVEFARASDAVSASLGFQEANTTHNEQLSDDIRPVVRIGIAMGEVVVADSTVTGEGIVLAQRLEQLAEPGGVCIQGAVYETLPKRLPFKYENLDEQQVKGFDEPVKIYAVSLIPGSVIPEPEVLAQNDTAAAELPDKPSIAVLPFDNMSGDKEQEYFSDGITEDIITELSRFPFLFVIARHSCFSFKGKNIDIKEVGQRLGAEYVVEGSVRKAGSRVRISAQLIDVETGNHIWAERYDRELEDIFALQDEVVRAIVAVLPGRVEKAVAERGQRKPTDNMKAYEFVLRGKMCFNRLNADDLVEAQRHFEKAIELDPRYARAHAHLAITYLVNAIFGWETADFSQETIESARKAAALDSNDIFCESVLGYAYLVQGMWEDSEKQFNKVIAHNVNDAEIMAWNGDALNMLGRHEEGRNLILEAMRLDPLHPPLYDWFLGGVLYSEKRYGEVIQTLTGGALLNSAAYAWLAGAYAYLGRVDEARRALDAFIRERRRELSKANIHIEDDTIGTLAEVYRNHYRLDADWENVFNGLRKAGLPE